LLRLRNIAHPAQRGKVDPEAGDDLAQDLVADHERETFGYLRPPR
jgi:hypothetical protein